MSVGYRVVMAKMTCTVRAITSLVNLDEEGSQKIIIKAKNGLTNIKENRDN